jgi:protein-tyrosine phosphatase
MRAEIYSLPIPFHNHLSIMPHPRGGDWLADEIAAYHAAGVRVLVSLLTPEEAWDLELTQEAELCQAAGITFLSFPIPDRGMPPFTETTFAFIGDLERRLMRDGRHVAIHCWAGIGRSSLMAASVLAHIGLAPERAFAALTRVRGLTVPDMAEQVRWVEAFAAHLRRARSS